MRVQTIHVLRFTMVGLFLWFGCMQLLNATDWVGFLPAWTGYMPIPGEMLVRLNGLMEVVLVVLLALGLYTRIVSAFLGVHLLFIAISVGGAIGVRDAALGLCALAISCSEPDAWTLDAKGKK